jgi:transposase
MGNRPPYPSDLSEARWALIAPTLIAWRQARTDAGVGGRRAHHDLREIFNAILFVNRTGIPWRYLPHDLPPWATVYSYFTLWTNDGLFTQLNYDLTGLARAKAGRTPQPTAAVIDTQSIKTSPNAPAHTQGIDAGKKIVGRKRGIVTDTLGLLLAVIVAAASLERQHHRRRAARPGQDHPPHTGQDLGRRRVQDHRHRTRRHPRHRRRSRHQGPHYQGLLGRETALGHRANPRVDHAAPQARPRLRNPPRQLRRHDPDRDDRQRQQTPHRRNHPNMARHLNTYKP